MNDENVPQGQAPPTPEAVQAGEVPSAQKKGTNPPRPQEMQRNATGGGRTSEGDGTPKN